MKTHITLFYFAALVLGFSCAHNNESTVDIIAKVDSTNWYVSSTGFSPKGAWTTHKQLLFIEYSLNDKKYQAKLYSGPYTSKINSGDALPIRINRVDPSLITQLPIDPNLQQNFHENLFSNSHYNSMSTYDSTSWATWSSNGLELMKE